MKYVQEKGYFLLFIGTLIHNEIIILNFCNLSKDTKKLINELKTENEKLLICGNNPYIYDLNTKNILYTSYNSI